MTVDIMAANFIDGWAPAPAFTGGQGNSADNLAEVMSDIRWNGAPNPVTMDVSGDVTVIDVASRKALKSIKVGRFPWGAAFRPTK